MTDIEHHALLVIGGGPGGYVAAIRAGQLGIPTMLVEGETAGRHLPERRLHSVQGADPRGRRSSRRSAALAAGDSALGIKVAGAAHRPRADRAWKDGIVARLTGGVGALLKKNGVTGHQGLGQLIDGKTVERDAGRRDRRRRCASAASTCCWPPVPTRSNCRCMPFGGRVISSTEALRPPSVPQAPGRRRRRLHRAGAGHRLSQARRRGHRRRGAGSHPAGLRRGADASRCSAALQQGSASSCTWATACRALNDRRRRAAACENAGRRVRRTCAADQMLVAVGRKPHTAGLGPGIADAGHGRPRRQGRRASAAPRCATSGPSATSAASRCWRTARWRRARWSPRSSPASTRHFDAGRDRRRCASPIRRSWSPA